VVEREGRVQCFYIAIGGWRIIAVRVADRPRNENESSKRVKYGTIESTGNRNRRVATTGSSTRRTKEKGVEMAKMAVS
jgi:hypothetical protein